MAAKHERQRHLIRKKIILEEKEQNRDIGKIEGKGKPCGQSIWYTCMKMS